MWISGMILDRRRSLPEVQAEVVGAATGCLRIGAAVYHPSYLLRRWTRKSSIDEFRAQAPVGMADAGAGGGHLRRLAGVDLVARRGARLGAAAARRLAGRLAQFAAARTDPRP